MRAGELAGKAGSGMQVPGVMQPGGMESVKRGVSVDFLPSWSSIRFELSRESLNNRAGWSPVPE